MAEARLLTKRPPPACSFPPALHPHYQAIKAECEPWMLDFISPASEAAADFWRGCAFPLLGSLAYSHCAAPRVILIVKLLTWYFASDSDDDNPSVRGCETDRVALRHQLILACHAGKPLHYQPSTPGDIGAKRNTVSAEVHADVSADASSDGKFTKELAALHGIWRDILPDMPLGTQQRFLEAMKDYLNANRLQAHYRKEGRLPGLDEYVYSLRRPASFMLPCLILMEYALGIELDKETVGNNMITSLVNGVVDHVGLANDVVSCEAERCYGDYFNLPCVILRERAASQPGFTFAEAMQEALRMVEEVDGRCVKLMKEVESSRLIEKVGMRAYLRGLELWMAGNVEWSLKTARYSHTCSAQGIVQAVPVDG